MHSSIAIIGSFQKYYENVVGLISYFNKNGVAVISPNKSRINNQRAGFVVFESDNSLYSDTDIQTITLDKILNADAVYVYDPDGYVGKTTCYEIGICMCKNKSIYYLTQPDDLPVPVAKAQIVAPEELIEILLHKKYKFIDTYDDLCPQAQKSFSRIFGKIRTKYDKNNLLVCGSMAFYDDMVKCQNELIEKGINVIIPEDESLFFELLSNDEAVEFKKKVSRSYLKKIRGGNTAGILVFNECKNGIQNYIGPNTIAEIVTAFSWGRRIYLLNDIYKPLSDELVAWHAIPLNKEFTKLYDDLTKTKKKDQVVDNQLSLF